jgi:hypothetical protein
MRTVSVKNPSMLFTLRSYESIPAMTTNELEQQLKACIEDELRQQTCLPPRTADTSVTDAYYSGVAEKLLARIKADGWTIAPPRTRWAARPP